MIVLLAAEYSELWSLGFDCMLLAGVPDTAPVLPINPQNVPPGRLWQPDWHLVWRAGVPLEGDLDRGVDLIPGCIPGSEGSGFSWLPLLPPCSQYFQKETRAWCLGKPGGTAPSVQNAQTLPPQPLEAACDLEPEQSSV